MRHIFRVSDLGAVLVGVVLVPLAAFADDGNHAEEAALNTAPSAQRAEDLIPNLQEVLNTVALRTNPALFWIHRNDPPPAPQEEIITEGPIAVPNDE
jgi:hypothetical protein